jgi:hypothetical protein
MLTALALLSLLSPANASSHREAPAIAKDPTADLTDFYMFLDPDDTEKIVFIVNTNPLELPGGGPNFHFFDDDVRYNINIDNTGDGVAHIVFRTTFSTTYNYPDTFLYNVGDIASPANLNMVQTYTIERIENGVTTTVATGTVAPVNVGEASDPTMSYDPYSSSPSSMDVAYTEYSKHPPFHSFAGPRQEGFYVDLERTFDLLNVNFTDNQNTLLGYNVHSIALEMPTMSVTKDHRMPDESRYNGVIAAWATTERQATRVLNGDGTSTGSGDWIQVARLGNPLVNEAVIAVQDKDLFNATEVTSTSDYTFLPYVLDPLLIQYMNAILGVPVPSDADCDKGLGIGGREDLVEAFLIGSHALGTQPKGFALGGAIPRSPGKYFAAFEALRINLIGHGFTGWPNGRNVGDDVVDVALSAEAGLLCTSGGSGFIADGVDATGLTYLTSFPFLGDPWIGDDHPVMNLR